MTQRKGTNSCATFLRETPLHSQQLPQSQRQRSRRRHQLRGPRHRLKCLLQRQPGWLLQPPQKPQAPAACPLSRASNEMASQWARQCRFRRCVEAVLERDGGEARETAGQKWPRACRAGGRAIRLSLSGLDRCGGADALFALAARAAPISDAHFAILAFSRSKQACSAAGALVSPPA